MFEDTLDTNPDIFELGELQHDFDDIFTDIAGIELLNILQASCTEFLELGNEEAICIMENTLKRIDPNITLEGVIHTVGDLSKKLATNIRLIWEKFKKVAVRIFIRVKRIMSRHEKLQHSVRAMGSHATWKNSNKEVLLHAAFRVRDMEGMFKQFRKRMDVTWKLFNDMTTGLSHNEWTITKDEYTIISNSLKYWFELRDTTSLSKRAGRIWKASKYTTQSSIGSEIQDALHAGSEGMSNLNNLLKYEDIINRVRVRKLIVKANTIDPLKYIRRSAKLLTVSIIENARMLASVNSILENVMER